MSDIALSTMWAIGRFANLADFFTAGRNLGFTRFELNHAINSDMLDGLSLNGCISSVHEPCPADISTGTLKAKNWLISAPDEEDRQRGVAATKRSIDLAHRLGASAVIVHPGRVDIDEGMESRLVGLHNAGKSGQPEYVEAKERLVAARTAQAEVNMRSVRRSLLELAEYAAPLGVRLSLENRFHYFEIPQPDELDELLSLGCGDVVAYWHDVGHAEVLQRLGFRPHEEWLQRFSERMVGIHLHDVAGITDHLAAGLGDVDWDMVFRHVPDGALQTCEFLSSNSPEQVSTGLHRLLELRQRG